PVLEPSGKMTNHLAFDEAVGQVVRPLVVAEAPVWVAVSIEIRLDLLVRELRPPVRSALTRPRVSLQGPRTAEVGVVDVERGPQRASGIAGRWLNPQVVERPFAQEPPVGYAIQCHAAGQAELRLPRQPVRGARHAQHHLLG